MTPSDDLTRAIWAAALVLALGGCAGGAFTVYEENDVLSPVGARDRYYTQGLRMSRVFAADATPVELKQVAERLPFYDAEATTSIGIVVGQNIYTPQNIDLKRAQPDDRPYAGWLYAGVVASEQEMKSDDRADDVQQTLEIDVGVVGDHSYARSTQTRWHRIINSPRPRGWRNQIRFEPGIVASYEHRDRAFFAGDLPLETAFDVIPSYGLSLGNVDTHAGAGAQVRFGVNLPRDFGVNTISTTAMEVPGKELGGGLSVHVFGAAEGRAVGRNIFLDGNTFRDSPSVDKRVGVAECRAGLSLQYKIWRLTYSWITRSPEFRGQDGWTRYGSLSLGLFLDF